MARKSLLVPATPLLVGSVLTGCGTPNTLGLSQTSDSSATADGYDPNTTKSILASEKGYKALNDELTKTKKNYNDLRSAWERETSQAEKNRYLVRMSGELESGMNRLSDLVFGKSFFGKSISFPWQTKEQIFDLDRDFKAHRATLNNDHARKIEFLFTRIGAIHKDVMKYETEFRRKWPKK